MSEKVSVIIPYLEDDVYLAILRNDLSLQTYKNIELIFIHDSKALGPSYARNKALRQASGEIILFCDADDRVASDWIERMVEGLGDADIGWAGFSLISGDGGKTVFNPEKKLINNPSEFFYKRVFGYRLRDLPKIFLPGGLWENCAREWAGVWRLALRRAALSYFDENLRLAEDAIFITTVAKKAKTLSVFGDAGYRWFVRDTGTMNNEPRVRFLENKIALLRARMVLDPTMRFHRGSFILSFLQIFFKLGPRAAWQYARNLKRKN